MSSVTPHRDRSSATLAAEICIGAVVVATLYVARQILVPIALAVLFSFILTPVVVRLRRWHLGQIPAVTITVVLAFLLVTGIMGLIAVQLAQLARELPSYQTVLTAKIKSVQRAAGNSPIVRQINHFVQSVQGDIGKPSPAPPKPQGAAPEAESVTPAQRPMPVVVSQPNYSPIEIIQTFVGPLIEPLATIAIVVVFVIFILIQRQDLRDRLIWLTGSRDLRRATLAIDDAAERLSRLLLTQTGINAGFGILAGFGLWLIGVPNPILWAVLAALLRFVPYIGTVISVSLPMVLAAAADPGWSKVLWTLGLFGSLELVASQAIEPLLYGRSTGLSPVAVVVTATFWTWLWGPIGLVLSTPLTLLLVVVGQHVERLTFLAVLLGTAPALSPVERFFQRMMAGDADEATEQGEQYLKEHSLIDYYDDVVLPGLRLAQSDADRASVESDSLVDMAATVEEIVDNFADHEDAEPAETEVLDDSEGDRPLQKSLDIKPEWSAGTPILCVTGRSPLDKAAGLILRQLLSRNNVGVRMADYEAATPAQVVRLDMQDIDLICLSQVAAERSPASIRFLIRRLRRQAPRIKIIAAFWTHQEEAFSLERLRTETGADIAVTCMRQAIDACLSAWHGAARGVGDDNDPVRKDLSPPSGDSHPPLVAATPAETADDRSPDATARLGAGSDVSCP